MSPSSWPAKGPRLAILALGSLGVVYGDIGTSPLYALRECFNGEHSVPPNPDNVIGILSLVLWSLLLLVSTKYMVYVLRADNQGEGGILALMALALARVSPASRQAVLIASLGLLGAALLYGDGIITPAISVLSAVEGLEITVPELTPYVVPITVAILVALFAIQRRGSARIGSLFAPVMLVWFTTIGIIGLPAILREPRVLWAINPLHGVRLLAEHGMRGFLVLGGVFLVLTGAEALYADIGHFGRRPIRLTWFGLVLPALVVNYFGQGANLLVDPRSAANPFFYLTPAWARLPMVFLAAMATVIASQALISGVFSVTRQASMLGYWPRVSVRHTSETQEGQIYVPLANWLLLFGSAGLVVAFGSSTRLAGAYGVAVTGTMLITTILAHVVARRLWGWSAAVACGVTGTLLVPDLSFTFSNLFKIPQGGYVPLVLGVVLFLLMTTWKKGRTLLGDRLRDATVNLEDFCELMRVERPARVPGTAVFMTATAEGVPLALMRNFEHNRAVHARNVLLTVKTSDRPWVKEEERLSVRELGDGFVRVEALYGFTEEPDVPALLQRAQIEGLSPAYVTYFFGREVLLAETDVGMRRWRKRLFAIMSRNSQRPTAFFHIPPDQVVELGAHLKM